MVVRPSYAFVDIASADDIEQVVEQLNGMLTCHVARNEPYPLLVISCFFSHCFLSHFLFLTYTLFLFLSLSHTHSLSLSLSLSHTHTHSLFFLPHSTNYDPHIPPGQSLQDSALTVEVAKANQNNPINSPVRPAFTPTPPLFFSLSRKVCHITKANLPPPFPCLPSPLFLVFFLVFSIPSSLLFPPLFFLLCVQVSVFVAGLAAGTEAGAVREKFEQATEHAVQEDKAEDRDGSVTVELVFENEEAARAAYEAVNPADLPGGDNAVTFVGVRFTQGQRTRRRHPDEALPIPVQLVVRASLVGAIIGRGGANIKQLSESSRARVNLERRDQHTPGMARRVSIEVTNSTCMCACVHVCLCVCVSVCERESNSNSNNSSNNNNNSNRSNLRTYPSALFFFFQSSLLWPTFVHLPPPTHLVFRCCRAR